MARNLEKWLLVIVMILVISVSGVSLVKDRIGILDDRFTLLYDVNINNFSNMNGLVENAYLYADSLIVFVSTIDHGIFAYDLYRERISRIGVKDFDYTTPQFLELCDSTFIFSDISSFHLKGFRINGKIEPLVLMPHYVDRFRIMGKKLFHVNLTDSSSGILYVNDTVLIPKPTWFKNGFSRAVYSPGITALDSTIFFATPFEDRVYGYNLKSKESFIDPAVFTVSKDIRLKENEVMSPSEAFNYINTYRDEWIERFNVWKYRGEIFYIAQIGHNLFIVNARTRMSLKIFLGDYMYHHFDGMRMLIAERSNDLRFRVYSISESLFAE